jgi:adenine-specific DNA-methyltransferase
MGRQKTEGSSPFRFILNHSKAVATNSYHVLYPKKHLESVLQINPDVLGELWQALKSLTLENLLVEGRTYGGGLYKIEPGELANVLVENVPEILLGSV